MTNIMASQPDHNFCRKHCWLIINCFLLCGIGSLMLVLNLGEYRIPVSFVDIKSNSFRDTKSNNTIYIVTPTYARSSRMADMTRLSQTLRLVPNIHWIVVEDAENISKPVYEILRDSGIRYTYLAEPTTAELKKIKFGKGVACRRKALEFLRERNRNGVLYFADDDNAYDIKIFEEMRHTEKASVWPVGLIKDFGLSSPIVVKGKVVDFHDPYIEKRVFAMDMAGFAVSMKLLRQFPNATMEYRIAYLEDSFLLSLNLTLNDLEPKANNCTKILVWHTQTKQVNYPNVENLVDFDTNSNLIKLYRNALYGLNEILCLPELRDN